MAILRLFIHPSEPCIFAIFKGFSPGLKKTFENGKNSRLRRVDR
jgi:hypothetical protein